MKLSTADSAAVDKVCAEAAKCVVVIVSGRPLILDPQQLSHIDALVAAWLPGSEGAGVADTLFGLRPYTGKLPVTWPRTLEQEPINVGDASYDPLYPFGYGLRTRSHN
jgi:beta-glucosidase